MVYHEERRLSRGLFVEIRVMTLSLLVEVVLILHLLLDNLWVLIIVALIVIAMMIAIRKIAYPFKL